MREAPGFRTSDTFQREGSDGKIKPDMATADEVVPCPICGKLGNGHPSMCSCKSSPSDALRKRYMLAEAALSQMRERAERAEAMLADCEEECMAEINRVFDDGVAQAAEHARAIDDPDAPSLTEEAAELVKRLMTLARSFAVIDETDQSLTYKDGAILVEAAALITEQGEEIKTERDARRLWQNSVTYAGQEIVKMRERAERAEALMEHNSKAAHEAEIALEQAQAEIASLREALGKIVTNYHSVESAEIARAALADSGEKE